MSRRPEGFRGVGEYCRPMDNETKPWDEATVQSWPDDELATAYDMSLRVSRDAEEVHDMRDIAAKNANITAKEMKRRGIWEQH